MTKQFRSRDIFLSAAALSRTGEDPALERDRDLIIFVHPETPAFQAALTAYLGNQPFEIQDFVAAYKRLRNLMYNLRGSR